MPFQTVKRVLVGRPMQSERLGHTLLPKKIALPRSQPAARAALRDRHGAV